MPLYSIDPNNKYYSLYAAIRGDILRGKYAAGQKLPSKRAMAEEAGVSVVTVELAYGQLAAEGYIVSKERSGYFVESISAPPAAGGRRANTDQKQPDREWTADFVNGSVPADLFPFSVWAKLMRGVLLNCGERLLERVPCEGDLELRTEISAYLYRSRGIEADPARIIVGAGAEYLYGIIVQLLGRDRPFAAENPGYKTIAAAYALNGAKTVPVPVSLNGVAADGSLCGVCAVHISPSHQFPTGVITPVAARLKLAAWARECNGYIIEDDYDSEFRLSGRPLESMCGLCGDRVIYINTFSKSLAPSLRMGYMVLPPELYALYTRMFMSSANAVPLFEQKTLAAMLKGGYFERHIMRLKTHYRNVRRALREILAKLAPNARFFDTDGGSHFLMVFGSDGEAAEFAARYGINVKLLTDYLSAPLAGTEGCAVINYSGISQREIQNLRSKL